MFKLVLNQCNTLSNLEYMLEKPLDTALLMLQTLIKIHWTSKLEGIKLKPKQESATLECRFNEPWRHFSNNVQLHSTSLHFFILFFIFFNFIYNNIVNS